MAIDGLSIAEVPATTTEVNFGIPHAAKFTRYPLVGVTDTVGVSAQVGDSKFATDIPYTEGQTAESAVVLAVDNILDVEDSNYNAEIESVHRAVKRAVSARGIVASLTGIVTGVAGSITVANWESSPKLAGGAGVVAIVGLAGVVGSYTAGFNRHEVQGTLNKLQEGTRRRHNLKPFRAGALRKLMETSSVE